MELARGTDSEATSTPPSDADSTLSSTSAEAANLMSLARRTTDFEVVNFALQELHHLKLSNRQVERLGYIPFVVECVQRKAVSRETADLILPRFRKKEWTPVKNKKKKKQLNAVEEPPKEKIVLKISLGQKRSSTVFRSPEGDRMHSPSERESDVSAPVCVN
ncbi:hypothetical protein QR680_018970 [Steinernema hermaphroditum]|nr:hypothetical protein QR680_018970 [Steinernema hermaphroditum]